MNVEHYTKQAVRPILHEHDRTAKNYSSKVDPRRSDLNFSVLPGENNAKSDADYVCNLISVRAKDILGDRYAKMQSTTKVMAEWSLTYPVELCEKVEIELPYKSGAKKGQMHKTFYYRPKDPEHCQRFFEVAIKMLVNRYGEENFLGAYVHMDETTPHMHFDFVPEAVSRKTGERTISAASLFTPFELSGKAGKNKNGCQYDMQMIMIKEFGTVAKEWILNGNTEGKTTKQLRLEQELEELKEELIEQKNALDERENALNEREKALKTYEEVVQQANDLINAITDRQAKKEAHDELAPVIKRVGHTYKNFRNSAVSQAHEVRQEAPQPTPEALPVAVPVSVTDYGSMVDAEINLINEEELDDEIKK